MQLEDRAVPTVHDQTLSCIITDLLDTVTVQWKKSDQSVIQTDSSFTITQGTVDQAGQQISTLTVTSAKLVSDSPSTTYFCTVLSGDGSTAVVKQMTLTNLVFGKNF